MKLWQIILLTIIFIIPNTLAATTCNLNENCTLWATITESGGFYAADHANLTVIYSNGTNLIDNQEMVSGGTGIFKYTFVPTAKDQYLAYAEFYNTTGNKVATSTESVEVFSIKSSGGLPGVMGSAAGLTQIIGLGLLIGLLFYFSFKMDKHPVLQLLLFFSCFALLLMIPKVLVDNNQFCTIAPTNTTESGSTTLIGYDYVCIDNPSTTATSLLKIFTKIYYAVLVYAMLYMLVQFGLGLREWIRGLK